MEVLERIGDILGFIFGGLAKLIDRGLRSVFGSANERYLKRLQGRVAAINALEPKYIAMSDAELRSQTELFRQRLKEGETLEDLLVEAFAVGREAGRRWLNMRHFDVQLMGGMVLHNGAIAEMVTGEGKTLVATLPAYLNALAGKGVHVVTVNDYLARRDMEWMGPLYLGLGLTVGAIYADMDYDLRLKAYECDITYGTNNEFGFDYLRDNMKPAANGDKHWPRRAQQCQCELNYAIIDEVDNILVDEARTPLIISGPAHDDVQKYAKADAIARQLKKDAHFEVKEKEHTCHLTDEGVRAAEKLAGVESFYTAGNMEWPHLIDNSLKAHHLYKLDVNYVSENDEIIIVDEFTGRKMPGRQWSDGLHQAVEAKEGVRIKEETQTMATITLQNFFKLYKKIAGMTGTAMTEANEFKKIYKLDVVAIPTNMPLTRLNYPDVIYRSESEKFNAIADEIELMNKWDLVELKNGSDVIGRIVKNDDERVEIMPKDERARKTLERSQIAAISRAGRPTLVGTVSIEKSERLSSLLERRGIKHETLNAKNHKREAEIIAQAGRKSAVTISTNMAGRGTDIILGGNPDTMAWAVLQAKYASRLDVPKEEWVATVQEIEQREKMKEEGREVAGMGGLHVIGTERHESRRIDNQLRGRSGRQGDPGTSRFFLSLEDDLMRIFAGEWVKNILTRLGMKEGEAIISRMVTRRIEGAQKKVEEIHFERRKSLLDYDEVMDEQRKRVYGLRQKIITGKAGKELIVDLIDKQINDNVGRFLDPNYGPDTFAKWSAKQLQMEPLDARDLRDMDFPSAESYVKDQAEQAIANQIHDILEENLNEDVDPEEWNWEAVAKIANTRWQLSLPARELKRVGRDALYDLFHDKAVQVVREVDLSEGAKFLEPDFGIKSALGWAKYKFGVDLALDKFKDLDPEEFKAQVRQAAREAYAKKEAEYPVMAGLYKFSRPDGPNSRRIDRDALLQWARDRFHVDLDLEDLKSRQREEVMQVLVTASQSSQAKAQQLLEEGLSQVDKLFAASDGGATARAAVGGNGAVDSLAGWLAENLQVQVPPDDIGGKTETELKHEIAQAVEGRFQPEIRRMEQLLLLELLDSAWKDHLLAMDHLKQSIGMRGYAQIDPKVEYKREGMRMFEQMWQTIGEEATRYLFHMEHLNEDFVGSTWTQGQAKHDTAPSTEEIARQQQQGGQQVDPDAKIEPIRYHGQRVGRNDPCPCGSGKKYKHCCLRKGG